jgi:hypothetical protein
MPSPLQVEKYLGLASQDPVQVVLWGGKHIYVGELLVQDQHSSSPQNTTFDLFKIIREWLCPFSKRD